MIRKMLHMDAPRHLLLEICGDSEAWPAWMPGVQSAKTVRDGDQHRVVLVTGSFSGMNFSHEMDLKVGVDTVRQFQKEGWPVKWGITWRFTQPPNKLGTTVLAEIDLEFAPFAPVPKKMVNSMMRRMMEESLVALKKRAHHLHEERPEEVLVAEVGEKILLSVYQTEQGLEVVVGDQKWVIG